MYELVAQFLDAGLLLAEGGLGVGEMIGIGTGTGAVGVGATVAVLKWRQSASENKDKEQDAEQKELSKAVNELTQTVIANAGEIKQEIGESEKRTDEKLKDLTKTISRKIEGIKEVQGEHGQRLAVIENDNKHMNDRLDSHARKLTRLPTGSQTTTGSG